HLLLGLVRLFGQHEQTPRGLTRFHAPRAFPSAREEVRAELTVGAQVAFHLAEPNGETARIGKRRPHLVDMGVERSSMRTMPLPSADPRLPRMRSPARALLVISSSFARGCEWCFPRRLSRLP